MSAAQNYATNIKQRCLRIFCLIFWLRLRVLGVFRVDVRRSASLFRQGLLIVPVFWNDRRGVGAWEYAVLAALLGLVLVTVLQAPVHELSVVIGNWMASAGGGGGGGGGSGH